MGHSGQALSVLQSMILREQGKYKSPILRESQANRCILNTRSETGVAYEVSGMICLWVH